MWVEKSPSFILGFRNTKHKWVYAHGLDVVYLLVDPSSSWASKSVPELCVTFAVQRVGAMELCLPSLSAPAPGACTASFLLGKVSCRSGRGWGHLGAAGLRCPELCSCRIQGGFGAAGSKLSTCSPTSVSCCDAGLSVPNEHWKMAHLHGWVFQQTKENLLISSWLAGSKFCWAARKDSEGLCYLKNLFWTCMKQLCCGTTAAWATSAEAEGRFLGWQVPRVARHWAIPSSEKETGTNYHPACACAALATLTKQLIQPGSHLHFGKWWRTREAVMPWSMRICEKMLRNYGNVLVMKGKPQSCSICSCRFHSSEYGPETSWLEICSLVLIILMGGSW